MTLHIRVDGAARIDGEPARDETIATTAPVDVRSDGPVGLTIEAESSRRDALRAGLVGD